MYIIHLFTRDAAGFAQSKIPVKRPEAFLDWVERERGRRMLVKPGGDALNGRSLKDVLAEMRYADYEALS